MARHTFFSFHYQRDVQRAWNVRNSWVTKDDRDDAGFFDDGLWEKAKKNGDDDIKRLINSGMKGTTVACVCVGYETWARRWVRYELQRAFLKGKGLLGVHINEIKNLDEETDERGKNPLDYLAFKIDDDKLRLKENFKGEWRWSRDFPDAVALDSIPYDFGDKKHHTFATLFKLYDWYPDDGRANLGDWIQDAATAAGC